MNTAEKIIHQLQTLANSNRAQHSARYFKSGPGEYGEGDIFLGITVPMQRQVARTFAIAAQLSDITHLLKSKIHEHRLVALFIMNEQYAKTTPEVKLQLFELYLKHKKYVNNWDLVDSSAPYIVGDYLFNHPGKLVLLDELIASDDLWDRRIAVLATFTFIKNHHFQPSLKLATILLTDKRDLIQKAVGWMLRELGKKDLPTELVFLEKHAHEMPRTMLRYALERLTPAQKTKYMTQKTKATK